MTNLKGLGDILAATNIPTKYGHFSDKPSGSYIEFEEAYSRNFDGDNKVYFPITRVDIILYTRIKDQAAEATIQNALDAADIVWTKTEQFLSDERIYEIIYEVDINGKQSKIRS